MKNIVVRFIIIMGVVPLISGCALIGNNLNPFAEPASPEALLGDRNDNALSGGENKIDSARAALEHMASYQGALPAEPVNPVMKPAIVRLMWIPDHLNKNGDLVPAHY